MAEEAEDLNEEEIEVPETETDDVTGAEETEGEEGSEEEREAEAEPDEDERLARERGWKSRSEWKGTVPRNFIDDPKKFNEGWERRADIDALENRLKSEEGARKSAEGALALARKTREAFEARVRKEAKEEAEELLRKAKAAFADGDDVRGEELLKKRDDALEESRAPVVEEEAEAEEETSPVKDPHFVSFVAENPWYRWSPSRGYEDPDRADYANEFAQDLARQGVPPADRYPLVAKAVQAKFGTYGEKKQEQPQRRGSALNGDGGDGGVRKQANGKSPSWESIPAEMQREINIGLKHNLWPDKKTAIEDLVKEGVI